MPITAWGTYMCSKILRKEGGKETHWPHPHIKMFLTARPSLHSQLLSNYSFKAPTTDRAIN